MHFNMIQSIFPQFIDILLKVVSIILVTHVLEGD